jgi:hypothetical protein
MSVTSEVSASATSAWMLGIAIGPVVGIPDTLPNEMRIDDVNVVASVAISVAMVFELERVAGIIACTLTDPALRTTVTSLA